MVGHHGLWGKRIYFEPSVAVPLLIAGPGIASGQRWSHPVSLLDLFPTACGLAGLPIPAGLDGVDQSAALRSPTTAQPIREYAPSSYYDYGIRINHRRNPDPSPNRAMRLVRTHDWKLVQVERGQEFLFNLAEDPAERVNRLNDPSCATIVGAMRAMLARGFDWESAHRQLEADRRRVPEFLSGQRPSMPNQYTLRDGRVCDAETGLYDARWLYIPKEATGGIIPQMLG